MSVKPSSASKPKDNVVAHDKNQKGKSNGKVNNGRCWHGIKCKQLREGYCRFIHSKEDLAQFPRKPKALRNDKPKPIPEKPKQIQPRTLQPIEPKLVRACKVCFIAFDTDNHFPLMISQCGHTFCKACCVLLEKCPTCRSVVDQSKVFKNYELLDNSEKTGE